VILAHHGGELPLVLASIAGAGAVPPLLMVARARVREATARLRRRRKS
jgi:hypothetical protein